MIIHKFFVSQNNKIEGGVFHLVLKPKEENFFDFKPGQFVMLHSNENSSIKRAFSIASSPTNKIRLDFIIKMKGIFTNEAARWRVGEEVSVSGPFGVFVLDDTIKKAAFIAAGVGIAPVLSMLRYIKDKNLPVQSILFYSSKTKDEIVFPNEVEDMATKTIITLTREEKEEFERGRVNKEMMAKYLKDPAETNFFICGSKEFADTMKQNLLELGVDEKLIKFEKF